MSSSGTLSVTDSFLVWGVHFSGIIFSAIFGTFLTKHIQRDRFLTAWMALGALSSLTLFAVGASTLPIIALIVLLLGVSLGIGMPACMGYFTESVPIENRGLSGGIVMLLVGIGVFILTAFPLVSAITLGFVLAAWRLSSLLLFYTIKSSSKILQEKDVTSYRQISSQQPFILYLIPWLMFSLVNYVAGPVQVAIVGKEAAATITIVQSIMMGVFALVGGILLDIIGRKRVAIFGFTMLGVDAATLGLFPKSIWSNYFSGTVDGIAFGFLFVIFIVTIWGDLSQNKNSSKYYAIGVLPFFLSKFLELTIGKDISQYILNNAGTNGLFSFLAFFLFMAVLPLVYAPETLPEKTMKDRELKNYVEKAQKIVAKEEEKKRKNEKPKNQEATEAEENTDENSEEYDEARKLAEKYY